MRATTATLVSSSVDPTQSWQHVLRRNLSKSSVVHSFSVLSSGMSIKVLGMEPVIVWLFYARVSLHCHINRAWMSHHMRGTLKCPFPNGKNKPNGLVVWLLCSLFRGETKCLHRFCLVSNEEKGFPFFRAQIIPSYWLANPLYSTRLKSV